MSEQPGPEPVIVVQREFEVVQARIHRDTAFVAYAAAAVQGLCAGRNPRSKEEGEEIITYAHWLAGRLLDGPLTPEAAA